MIEFIKDDGGRSKYYPSKLKKDKAYDCTIRAIAIGTEKDYKEVWDALFSIGTEIGQLPNSWEVVDRYLTIYGWKKHKPFRDKKGKRYRLRYMGNVLNHSQTYIIKTSSHLTVVVDGTLRDTWNCQNSVANSYYTNNNT